MSKLPFAPSFITYRNQGRSITVQPTLQDEPLKMESVLDLSVGANDDGSTMLTVGLINNGPTLQLGSYRPVAIINIGNSGVGTQLELDFNNGTMFSVGGSSLRISAYVQFVQQGPLDVPTAVNLGAFASLGATSRNEKLKRTFSIDTPLLPGAISPDFNIPRFASSLMVLRSPFNTAFRVIVKSNSGNTIYTTEVSNLQNMLDLDLVNDSFKVSIENIGALSMESTKLAFGISL